MYTKERTYFTVDSAGENNLLDDSLRTQNLQNLEKDSALFFSYKDVSIYASKASSDQGKEGQTRPFTLDGDDGIFALLLLCFVLFTRIYKSGLVFFKESFRILFSFHKSQNLFSETTTTDFWFNFILIFQSILLSSVVVFDSILESRIELNLPINSFYTIILFIFSITIFLLLKYLFYRFIGFVFEIQEQIHIWIRNYILVLEMLGIVAFIPSLVLVYYQNFHEYLLIFFFVLFIISRLILFYRITIFFLHSHVNFLFLIPYLCSVEIVPYLLLYQILVHLYNVDIINLL